MKINLDHNCNLQIEVSEDDKAHMLDQYKLMVSQSNDASRWLVNKGQTSKPPRITPAYAGTTELAIALGDIHGDHPRLCGDHVDS